MSCWLVVSVSGRVSLLLLELLPLVMSSSSGPGGSWGHSSRLPTAPTHPPAANVLAIPCPPSLPALFSLSWCGFASPFTVILVEFQGRSEKEYLCPTTILKALTLSSLSLCWWQRQQLNGTAPPFLLDFSDISASFADTAPPHSELRDTFLLCEAAPVPLSPQTYLRVSLRRRLQRQRGRQWVSFRQSERDGKMQVTEKTGAGRQAASHHGGDRLSQCRIQTGLWWVILGGAQNCVFSLSQT